MSIVADDILFKYSTKIGSAGNQNAQTNQNASLGKYISTTEWPGGTVHDLFAAITGADNANSTPTYRCIFIHNNHGSLTYQGVVVWVSAQVSGGADVAIGLDITAPSGISSASAQAVSITNEKVAPSAVTFTTPTTEGAGLAIGDLLPGECKAIWIKRTPANTVAVSNDGATFSFSGDSV